VRIISTLGIVELVMKIGAMLGFTEAKLKMPDYNWPTVIEQALAVSRHSYGDVLDDRVK